jgi:predicted MFS family arabinose efflux permease
MPLKELILLITLALVQFTNIMDFMVMMPLGPQLMELFSISPKQFGFIVASYTYTAGIIGFLGVFFLDLFNRRRALIFAYAGFLIGTLFCGIAKNYEFLILARIFTGIFGGVLSSIVFAIVGDAIPIERRGLAMGIIMTSFSLASALGVPFGLYLASIYNWNAPFLFLVGIASFVMVLILIVVPSMKLHLTGIKQSPLPILTNILQNNNQFRALILMALVMFGQMTIIPYITPYMVGNVGFKIDQLPLIYLFGGMANFISMPIIGKLSDKFGFARMFAIMLSLSMIPVFLITNLPSVSLQIGLVVTTLFMVLVGGRIVPTLSLITSTVLPKNRGSFMSFASSIQQIFSGVATTVAGYIVYKSETGAIIGYNIVGYIALACAFTAIFVGLTLKSAEEK